VATIRLKFGRNPYTNAFTCAKCQGRFDRGGLCVRLEFAGRTVDVPVCPACERTYGLFEGTVDLDADNLSHPIGVA
jgi:hypothetical protein